jgi:small-conductance mechanosensitive channel
MHNKRSTIRLVCMTGIIWALMCLPGLQTDAQMMPPPKGKTAQNTESGSAVELPPDLDPQKVDSIIASMDDEQVRRLLIRELKKQAEREAARSVEEQPTGLAGLIQRSREMLNYLQARIEFLRSGVDVPVGEETSDIFTYLGTGEKTEDRFSAIMSVVAVFAASLLIAWLFHFYTRGTRRRIETADYSGLLGKVGALSFRALLDALSILVFAAATLAIFYFFLERNTAQRILVASYLGAFAIVWLFQLVSRFLLAPHAPAIRVLPLQDETAVYLHRWLSALVVVWAFGMLTCGIFRLAGTSEARHFVMTTGVGLLMAIMLVIMILQKRRPVAAALMEGRSPNSLRVRMARSWHHIAIFGVFLLIVFSTFERLLYGGGNFSGIKTLLLVALYFLLDWLLRQALEFAFGLAKRPEQIGNAIAQAGAKLHAATEETEAETPQAAADAPLPDEAQLRPAPPAAETVMPAAGVASPAETSADPSDIPDEKETQEPEPPPSMDRMKHVLRVGLRIALGALIFFWIMKLWGVSLPVGAAVADATFDILITVLVCYVAWELISAAIQRRLAAEMPEMDDEAEEGGAGGSRIGTLLLLLRKFMLAVMVVMLTMIVLSRMGVNIGPLIAGAGVIGLAIGFGAQTLVRDIISGVFFLVDDAFRVGDYIETGGSKGTVEQLSLRSFKLRHPRGMLYTIPFGDIGMVTNLSRDYIITKLDFRVRYDTDVEKVRRLIKKKVFYPIRDNPELGPKLLDVIKSQGVREMQDSAMVMRVKYKTRPGDQFVIRKEVYRLMQEAFREEGIEFAHRNVTVYMPPGMTGEADENAGDATEQKQKLAQAAAAAGAAIAQQEEETQQQQPK